MRRKGHEHMIAIIDYDAGNIKSVEKAMHLLGQEVVVTRDRESILKADKVILPGVGAFGDAMRKIRQYNLEEVIHEVVEKGTPFLGICLGLQLLFERSDETPGVEGLGILKGEILRIPISRDGKPILGICLGMQLLGRGSEEGKKAGMNLIPFDNIRFRFDEIKEDMRKQLKIPHMGWNSLKYPNEGRLFRGIPEDSYVYFVHSYYLNAEDESIVTATTEYSTLIHASVESGNVFACQFHPEKSSDVGIQILKNFVEL